MGFAGYFLIVADFIRWARENGIPVGPGPRLGRRLAGRLRARHHRPRSAALRPAVRALPQSRARVDAGLRHRLLHGRPRPGHRLRRASATAASASRRSSPTAPWRRRRWCATSAACSGMSYGFVDRIAKLIPFELGITLEDALEKEPELKRLLSRPRRRCANLIDLARSLEGLTRNAGTHAGGVVIAPSVLTDFAPLYCEDGRRQRRHAVRQGRRRGRGPGEVRLPRPAHADDHRLGRRRSSMRSARAGGEPPLDISRAADGRRGDLRAAEALPARPRCSSSNRAA